MFEQKAASLPAPSPPDAGPGPSTSETVLGVGIRIKGDIKTPSGVDLRGSVDGSFDVGGLFIVRESGRVTGNVTARDVVVHGVIEGHVIAEQKVVLGPSGRVQGNLRAKAVAIAEGAFFEGNVEMADPVSTETPRRETKVLRSATTIADGLPA
jgi:cytoskeletal protein CcmA (bactofilin family)